MATNTRIQEMDRIANRRANAVICIAIFAIVVGCVLALMYNRSQSREAYQKGYEAGKKEMAEHYDAQADFQRQQVESFRDHSEIE